MKDFNVKQIPGGMGRDFIRKYHYSRSCHNGPMCWGLFSGAVLIGVCAFATPNSENVRGAPFGREYVDRVTELHRLVVLDGTPTNTESWFISKALHGLLKYRPNLWAVLSFADGTEGHRGVIYQATNAIYSGTTGKARFYRDTEGRLRHPRQSGVNITPEVAESRGWTPEMREAKHRYVYLVGTPTQRKVSRKMLLLTEMPYPKEGE